MIAGKQDVIATVHGSFLCASLEIGMLRRALVYLCELRQAKPRALSYPHSIPGDLNLHPAKHQQTPNEPDVTSSGSMLLPDAAPAAGGRLSGLAAVGSRTGQVSVEAATAAAQGKVVKGAAAKAKRNLTMQVFLHCARIDVSAPVPDSQCIQSCLP